MKQEETIDLIKRMMKVISLIERIGAHACVTEEKDDVLFRRGGFF